jgi:hypothetical protein
MTEDCHDDTHVLGIFDRGRGCGSMSKKMGVQWLPEALGGSGFDHHIQTTAAHSPELVG